MAKDIKTKERFVELRAQGLSFAKIAEELEVSKPTLIKWSRELQEDIANLRAIEREALLEKHLALKDKRLELLGEQASRIKEELGGRDFSMINTDTLLNIAQVCKGAQRRGRADNFPG
ncbi:MAG: hypothetical protein ACYC5A_02630 [Thermoleophilia bacterium]